MRTRARRIAVRVSEEQYNKLKQKEKDIETIQTYMQETKVKITPERKAIFEEHNIAIPTSSLSLEQLIKRPEITMEFLNKLIEIPFSEEIQEQISINLKYEGYIAKAIKEAEKMLKLEKKQIPEDIDYDKINNIASETQEIHKSENANSAAIPLAELTPPQVQVTVSTPVTGNTSGGCDVIVDYRSKYFEMEEKNKELQQQIDELNQKLNDIKKVIE